MYTHTHTHTHIHIYIYIYIYIYIQDVSEIGAQTLRAYSTCKDEKKSFKLESGNTSYKLHVWAS